MLSVLFFTALALYFVSSVVGFIGRASGKNAVVKAGYYTLGAAVLIHLAYTVARGVTAGRLPLANQFEFSSAFAFGIAVMGIILQLRFREAKGWILLLSTPTAFLVLSYAALQPQEVTELMPSLKSAWFGLHIGSAVLSYSAFALAAVGGGRWLVLKKKQTEEAGLDNLERLSYKLICFGFMMLSVVILSGSIWAEQAWGSFWTWDPKETWALITWIIYAIYLHQRLRANWRGAKMAWLTIIAFILVLFTLCGVNVLLSGLHSYA